MLYCTRVIIQAASTIGSHVILNTGAQVDHDCVVGDFVHLVQVQYFAVDVQVGEGAFLGAGTMVIPGVKNRILEYCRRWVRGD